MIYFASTFNNLFIVITAIDFYLGRARYSHTNSRQYKDYALAAKRDFVLFIALHNTPSAVSLSFVNLVTIKMAV